MFQKCLILILCIKITYAFTCGHSNIEPVIRIINGTEARPHSWPWIVTIQHPLVGHICGGSLIDANYVISAAHCFFSTYFDTSIIYIGNHYLTDRIEQRTISEVIRHPSYVITDGNPNDIVLIKLNQSIDINIYPPICLSTLETPKLDLPGQSGIVIGWGMTSEGILSNALLQTTLNIYDPSIPQCQPYVNDTNKQLCVGVITGGTGSCSGDSGGPLMVKHDNRYYLVGIVSASLGGCGGISSLYIRVRAFMDWICQTDSNIASCSIISSSTSTTTFVTSFPFTQLTTTQNGGSNDKVVIILAVVIPCVSVMIFAILFAKYLHHRRRFCFSKKV